MRGFGLLELPENQIGDLTSVYGGFEVRLLDTLPIGIQPFAFVDVGVLGISPIDLETPIYWSPGLGLRLESPIGNFRVSLAHGYLTGNPNPSASHFQFFFSFGEEF
jgi:translocation and assembly module TamA